MNQKVLLCSEVCVREATCGHENMGSRSHGAINIKIKRRTRRKTMKDRWISKKMKHEEIMIFLCPICVGKSGNTKYISQH